MDKRRTLTSIPEQNETDDENGYKWVPKKKHEVLKAKYKCLKKLFQLYDANVIGLLPDPVINYDENIQPKKRRQRSHRTKTDACAGTTEMSCDDLTKFIHDKESIIITTINRSVTTTQVEVNPSQTEADSKAEINYLPMNGDSKTETSVSTLPEQPKFDKYAETINSNMTTECQCQHTIESKMPPQYPYCILNRRHKPTRFQSFLQRILGIRRSYISAGDDLYPASDGYASRERRRRKGIRFRRLRRPKKNKSDSDIHNPGILTYVQSVQRSCLMDKTPRQCPILGCQMISYGIINYNDHLNLCHFINRKYICHYCHEGFEAENEKMLHENQHIGINTLGTDLSAFRSGSDTSKTANVTQTEPEESLPSNEKLKKIVSFFDKLNNSDNLSELKKNEESNSNLPTTSESESLDSEKKVVNCLSVKKFTTSSDSSDISSNLEFTGVRCQFCGEHFKYRRQLSLHEELEHCMRNKFAKYHSCPGIMSSRSRPTYSEDGRIVFQSRSNSCIHCLSEDNETVGKSETELSCVPSNNIVYLTSVESVRKPSVVESLVNKVRSYKWESGSKIIRV